MFTCDEGAVGYEMLLDYAEMAQCIQPFLEKGKRSNFIILLAVLNETTSHDECVRHGIIMDRPLLFSIFSVL